MQHTLGVDVTKYVDGVRSTLPGRGGDMFEMADAAHVWQHFEEGCSVRVLHPQRWVDPLWKVRGCQKFRNWRKGTDLPRRRRLRIVPDTAKTEHSLF